MRFVDFGSGKISIATAKASEESPENMLLLEEGAGTGDVGQFVPGREKDVKVILEDLPGVCLRFANAESAIVLREFLDRVIESLAAAPPRAADKKEKENR